MTYSNSATEIINLDIWQHLYLHLLSCSIIAIHIDITFRYDIDEVAKKRREIPKINIQIQFTLLLFSFFRHKPSKMSCKF